MVAPNVATIPTRQLGADAGGVPIQAPTRFNMTDGTHTSPKTVSSTEIDVTIPTNAVRMVIRAVGADLRIAIADTGTASAPYYVLKDGQTEPFYVAGHSTLHFLRDASTDVVMHFRFEYIGA